MNQNQNLADLIVKNVISEFSKHVVNGLKPYITNFKNEMSQLLGDGLLEYVGKQTEKYSYIKTFLHRTIPRYFYDVYYPIELEVCERNNKITNISTSNVNNLFASSHFIAIIGDAGNGKSMLVKHLFLSTIMNKIAIPIVIDLRDLNKSSLSLKEFIMKLVVNNNLAKNNKIFERLLLSGEFIFFLDGYDELNKSTVEGFVSQLTEFIDSYTENKFIITSRPYSNVEMLPRFLSLKIKSFSKDDVVQFIQKQLTEEEVIEKIIKSIKEQKVTYLNEFIKNPLLLSLYILTFQSYSDIPTKKYTFYRRVVDVLFSEHDSLSKLGYERERRCSLSQEKVEEILKRFSIISYFESIYAFEKDYIKEKLKFIKSKMDGFHFEDDNFIYDLKSGVSLWTEDGGILTFSHRSIQEYFAALHIKSLGDTNKQSIYNNIKEKLLNNVNETRNFLSLCEEMDEFYYKKFLLLPHLESILNIIEENSNLNPISVRMFALYFNKMDVNGHTLHGEGITLKISFATDKIQNSLIKAYFSNFRSENKEEVLLPVSDFFKHHKDNPKLNNLHKIGISTYEDLKKEILKLENYIQRYEKQEKDLINCII